jgi:hypothetical protein
MQYVVSMLFLWLYFVFCVAASTLVSLASHITCPSSHLQEGGSLPLKSMHLSAPAGRGQDHWLVGHPLCEQSCASLGPPMPQYSVYCVHSRAGTLPRKLLHHKSLHIHVTHVRRGSGEQR